MEKQLLFNYAKTATCFLLHGFSCSVYRQNNLLIMTLLLFHERLKPLHELKLLREPGGIMPSSYLILMAKIYNGILTQITH
jgi:hypothetical protein